MSLPSRAELCELIDDRDEALDRHAAVTDAAIAWYEVQGEGASDEAVDAACAFLRETVEAFLAWRDEPDCEEVRR